MRILVAEDERVLADLVAEGLREQAMAVDVAYDGEAALECLAVNTYDVLVLDRDLAGVLPHRRHGKTGPPRERADPGHQFVERERLGQVVVGAQVQPADPFVHRAGGGQHQDAHRIVRLRRRDETTWSSLAPALPRVDVVGRGMGLLDLADALNNGGPAQATGDLALHVLQVIEAIGRAAATGTYQVISNAADTPLPAKGPAR